jgi:pilus assembly protein CpaB
MGMQADKRALLLAVTALCCGLVLGHLYLRQLEARVTGGAQVHVVVSTQDAPQGAVLADVMLATRAIPQAYVESRHILARDVDKLAGTRLQVAARANEALLWTDIAGMASRPRSLSGLIRPGLRAFSIRSDAGTLTELVRPGDRVDVVLLPTRGNEGAASPQAKPLLDGLLVLAVDDVIGADDERERAPRANPGITLAVTPEQGLTLSAAEQQGTLRLLLRNTDEVADAAPARAP